MHINIAKEYLNIIVQEYTSKPREISQALVQVKIYINTELVFTKGIKLMFTAVYVKLAVLFGSA